MNVCVPNCIKCLTGLVYLLHGHKVRHTSVLAEVDMYFIQIGMNTMMEGKWILGSCDSEDSISLVGKERFWILKKVSFLQVKLHQKLLTSIAHNLKIITICKSYLQF